MARLLIQLIGQPGSGKSFLARELAEMKQGVVLSFAKDVYRLAEIVKGRPINKRNQHDRELLKLVGTTWGRESRVVQRDIQEKLELHKPKEWGTPDIWVRMFISNCRNMRSDVTIVNDDTRFLNELELSIRILGFIPILLTTREEVRQKRLRKRGEIKDPSATDHLSEEVPNFLAKRGLSADLVPVIWNDDATQKPMKPWVYNRNDFVSIVRKSLSNVDLAKTLGWTAERAEILLSTVKKHLDERTESKGE